MVQEEKSFKNTYFMYSSGGLFVQYLLTICAIMFRRNHAEHFCETILNLEQVAQEEMLFKDISNLKHWTPFVQQTGTI